MAGRPNRNGNSNLFNIATRKEKFDRAKAFGKTLRALRMARGLQAKQVWMQLGGAHTYYHQVELGRNNYTPSLEWINKVSAIMGLTEDEYKQLVEASGRQG